MRVLVVGLISLFVGIAGCSTTEKNAKEAIPAKPPKYIHVPHPEGYTTSDVEAIFLTPNAPTLDSLKDCDKDFLKLEKLSNIKGELQKGSLELVKLDPVHYHWCFYYKLSSLHREIKKQDYIDARQKSVLNTYRFLTPLAHSFRIEYSDSRYLRIAVHQYRRLSEWLFFRKVEITPEASYQMLTAVNPFGVWRPAPDAKTPVLRRYGIHKKKPAEEALLETAPESTSEPNKKVSVEEKREVASDTEESTDEALIEDEELELVPEDEGSDQNQPEVKLERKAIVDESIEEVSAQVEDDTETISKNTAVESQEKIEESRQPSSEETVEDAIESQPSSAQPESEANPKSPESEPTPVPVEF